MRFFVLSAAVLAALALAGCGGDDDGEAGGDGVTVDLQEQSGSGLGGTVTLTPMGEAQTVVTIALDGEASDAPARPAHIHTGSCAELGGVEYPLESVTAGASETTVDAALADLQAGEFAVNLHESDEAIETYIACGDIPAAG